MMEKDKLTWISAKLCISSLNSHSTTFQPATTFSFLPTFASHGFIPAIVMGRFAKGGRCWSKRLGMLSEGFGVNLILYSLGNLGSKVEGDFHDQENHQ